MTALQNFRETEWKPKSGLPRINSVYEKVWLRINGSSKMLFLNLYLFRFSKFQMTIVRNLMEKPSFFIMDSEGFYEALLRHKYFWSTNFWQWNDDPFKIFSNLHGNAISFFIFSKWKKYCSLTFDDMLSVVNYGNLNSSSMQAVFKLGAVEYAFSFISISYLWLFYRAFVKNFMKKTIIFKTNFQNSFQDDVVYYRILRCQNLWC